MRLSAWLWMVPFLACAGYGTTVKRQFATRYGCGQIIVQKLGGTSYQASGCGVVATYSCVDQIVGTTAQEVCTEISTSARAAAGPPAAAAPPSYAWPPPEGRVYEHFDEFERITVVQADMTAGQRVLRIFGAPRRSLDAVYVDVVLPGAAPPGPDCSEVLLLFGEEVGRFPATTVGSAGEPAVRTEVPLSALEHGLAGTIVKYRFCGVDWQFTPAQVLTLRTFLGHFHDVATREPPITSAPAASSAPATAR